MDTADSLAEALPYVRRVQLDKGHYPWLEQPNHLRRVLIEFLAAEIWLL